MNLFQFGEFTLHSGEKSTFKIDCDTLTDPDLTCIAQLVAETVPYPFHYIKPIPQGGMKLHYALMHQATVLEEGPGNWLIVDDVYTTGASMEKAKSSLVRDGVSEARIMGAVIFARSTPPDWIYPIFTLNPKTALWI